jgi:drug/metabolite transporter (DMT)-like permease
MLTILLSLSAALAYSFYALGSHRLIRVVPWLTLGVAIFLGGVVLFIVPALLVDGLPFGDDELRDLGLAALGGLLYTAATPCFLLALRVGRLSLVTVLACLDGVFAAVIVIAMGERIGGAAAAGLSCAAAGGLLAAVERRPPSPEGETESGTGGGARGGTEGGRGVRIAAGAGLALLTSLAMAGLFLCFGSIQAFSPFTTVTVASLAGLAVLLPIALVRRLTLPPRGHARGVVGVSVLDAFALLAGSAGLALGPVAVAAVLQAQTATISTLLGVVALRERPAWWQVIGIVTTIFGVSLLAWTM